MQAPGDHLRFCDTDLHHLNWTFGVPEQWLGIFRTGEHLLELGYRSVTLVPVCLRLEHPSGHVVELIAHADTVTVELEPSTPVRYRALAARAIAADVRAASQSLRMA